MTTPAPLEHSEAGAPAEPGRLGVVYGLSCICHAEDGIRYIGQTRVKNPLRRFDQHLRVSKSGKNHWQSVYEWMPAHGETNIVFTVLEPDIPVDQLDYHEALHISAMRGAGHKLMNQDQFWWIAADGAWHHTWPTHAPFNAIEVVSLAFVRAEFARGEYPLSIREFEALFPATERQTVDGLAALLADRGRAEAELWREGRPPLEEVRASEAAGEHNYVDYYLWAQAVRGRFPFPKQRALPHSAWATVD
jgi:hypothetical protein